MNETLVNVLGYSFLVAIILLYFVPSMIAVKRNVRHTPWIITVNLFFGWTIALWIIPLIFALTGEKQNEHAN